MNMETTLSNKTTAYALLALIGTITLYVFGFNRGLTNVSEASLERANNEAKIEALEKKLTDLKAIEQQFAQAKAQVDALTVAMPADKQIAEVVAMIETMAARAGVVLDAISPSAPTPLGLPLSITVRGPYGSIVTLTEIMEKNVRPFRLGPINIVGGTETDLSVTFEVVAMYQVPGSDLPAEAASVEEQSQ